MTTLAPPPSSRPSPPSSDPSAGAGEGGVVDRARARASATIVVHTVVDAFSFVLVPLLPLLKGTLELSSGQVAALIALGSVSSGLVQPLIAWASDRFNTRALGTLGFLVAVVCVSLIGRAQSFEQLLILQALGAGGIGAFHPPAAAAIGQLSGARRTLGVALFYAAGMLGGIAGNALAPAYVGAWGLPALVWLIPPGLVFVGVLGWALHSVPHRRHDAHALHRALPPEERRERWRAVGLLYAGNVLRFTVNMALVHLFVVWMVELARDPEGVLSAQAGVRASAHNGHLQGAMQLGMGAAGLAAGWLLRTHHEKGALVLVPLTGSLAVLAIPLSPTFAAWLGAPGATLSVAYVLAVLAGVGFGGVVPMTISLAQRLLPHRTSLASGLMMGGAWWLAGIGPPMADALHTRLGLVPAFAAVAGLLVVAGLVSLALPSHLVRGASRG